MRARQKVDRRVQRTQRLLRTARVSLIEEKGFEALTVQDIIDRANVGRATFYAHFNLLVSGNLRSRFKKHPEIALAAKCLLASRRRLRYQRLRLVAALCRRSMPQLPRSRLYRPIVNGPDACDEHHHPNRRNVAGRPGRLGSRGSAEESGGSERLTYSRSTETPRTASQDTTISNCWDRIFSDPLNLCR